MTKDYIRDLDLIGLTARVRRLNDKLMSSGKKVYKILNIDIEPNWHLILLLLEEREKLTVTEIASILDFSHPAVIKITRKMIEKEYLVSNKDKIDSRKQILSLTQKAYSELPILKEKWEFIRQVHEEYISSDFIIELTQLEESLNNKSIEQRVIEKLNNDI